MDLFIIMVWLKMKCRPPSMYGPYKHGDGSAGGSVMMLPEVDSNNVLRLAF